LLEGGTDVPRKSATAKKPKKGGTKSVSSMIAEVNSGMGKDVIGRASDARFTVDRVPIGILAMERVTGGGFVRGRHVELFGDESTGKSLVLYMTLALAQQRGELCALVDGEHVFDAEWFTSIGGNPDDLLIFHPENAEEVIKVLMLFAQSSGKVDGVSICGIDSVASMLPREELEKDVEEGDDRVASRARMMSRLLRRVTTVNDKTLFIWTNQFIDKIGSYGGGSTTPGGRSLRFYATTRIEMRRGERVKAERTKAKAGKLVKKPTVIGHWVQLRSEKEKSARPYLESSFFFDAERGEVDQELSIINLGLEDGLVERNGNTFVYVDTEDNEWSGTEKKFKEILRDNEEVREEIEWAIRENTTAIGSGEEDDGES
jgi:recombination protein RecA